MATTSEIAKVEAQVRVSEAAPLYPGASVESVDVQNRLKSYDLLHAPRHHVVLRRWLLGLTIGFLSLLFLPWQQTIQGNGELSALKPEDRPQVINAVIGGSIARWYVQEGQQVKAGDTIVVLTEIKDKFFDPETPKRLFEQVEAKASAIEAMRQKLTALNEQIEAIKVTKTTGVAKAQGKLVQSRDKLRADSAEAQVAQADFNIATERFTRAKELYEKGLISLTDFESRKLKFQETEAKYAAVRAKLDVSRMEVINTQAELENIIADYSAKLAKAQAERDETQYAINDAAGSLAKLRNEATNAEIRSGYYVVRAPQNGVVVQAAKQGVGEIVKAGESIATIMPTSNDRAAALYVSATDVPLLDPGRPVRLQFDGWPALQVSGWPSVAVGTFGGIIANIDYVAAPDGSYRILVVPDPKDDPWPPQLRIGSGVHGWALLDNVSLGFEIWRQLNGFPPALRKKLDDTKADKKTGKKAKDSKGSEDTEE
jgi:multidrug resistance efflux pump